MPANTLAAPIPVAERLQSLDVARGCAVLGILIMNIWAFAGPQAFFDYPLAIAGRPGDPVATWAVMHTLFEGSQRGLLSLLFGAGALMLMTRLERGDRPGGGRAIYYRRTGVLILFGMFDAYVLMWPADILFAYGIAGLFLYPLRRLPVRGLLVVAVLALALPAALRVADIAHLRELRAVATADGAGAVAAADPEAVTGSAGPASAVAPQSATEADQKAWQQALAKAQPSADDPKITTSIREMQDGGFATVALRQARVSLVMEFIVGLRFFVLDAFAVMVLGMALWRAGVFAPGGAEGFGRRLALGGFAVGLPLSLWSTTALLDSGFDPVTVEMTKLVADVRRIGMACGYLGLVLLFCRQAWGAAVRARLAAVGRMALTNYLGQSILCGLVFYGFGLGLYGRVTGAWMYAVVLAVWIVEILFTGFWLARFRIGPFEWVWRSLTYGRAQPWRSAAVPVAS